MMDTQRFFDCLWQKYIEMTPQAKKIHDAFEDEDDGVVNDHVALRTFDVPAINITSLEPHIIALGYSRHDLYTFPEKKLDAVSYLPENDTLPRIFISQLHCHELSEKAQSILNRYISQIPKDFSADPTCFWHGRAWHAPTWDEYETLLAESEYAAWVLIHGLCANHFTISVNQLRNPDIELVNMQIEALGFKINDHGGKIKGSPSELLEQSSTFADKQLMYFSDGAEHMVTTCYYEFAKRYNDRGGRLFQGFIASSADKIFESTDMNNE